MAIKSGEKAESDEVMNAFGLAFKNQIQGFFNNDYDGWNSNMGALNGAPETSNFKYIAAKSGTNYSGEYDSGSSSVYEKLDSAVGVFYGATTVDEIDDSSIDGDIWSTATTGASSYVSEDNENIEGYAFENGDTSSAELIADQANATDYKAVSADSEVLTRVYMRALTTDADVYFQISDGGNHVTISSVGGDSQDTSYYRLVFDKSGQEVHVYNDGSEVGGSPFDLSALSNYYIRIFADTLTSDKAEFRIYYLREVTGAANTSTYYSTATNSGSTITNAILVANGAANGGSVNYYLSADNGANYESVTPNQIHRFTNTGNNLIVKVELTESNSIDETSLHHWTPWVGEYGVIYNWY